ncbi:hypothetical protein BATDEDRAFT_33115 [Batrachochytrium dendrobatidis JAM81]|uniref:RIB43A-like with coiled-coils protein 2 n=2 Tax=Batrachochytrium dendrobatidis TaxID=109871 RepID=F4P0F0_BATDJ|nr:uncharacterized protein BATDEDRAFT_33115 [Batrachochytrium dendrobatidis JAM81]EGF81576.1 hypothetical protein BATDEDRAFT_33115 [Batrachochytrium dendrobatidis JAM81]|eukprot:XP_006677976.1 hypothetical protein BATDEDRAFT_33115 [Batrachochytrium dendrobatidis JAM81]
MYKVEILGDTLHNAAIQRRQRLDEERKQRIFNPKVRILGIDLQALDEQIQIKNELKEIDKQRNDALDKSSKLNNDILQLMDEQVQKARRHCLQQTNQYRRDHQQPHQRRDYDLYDPKALQKDVSTRVTNGQSKDHPIGISSLQRFEGEDLAAEKRTMLQKDQMRVWANEQVFEKERRRQEELDEKKRYEEFQKSIGDKMAALQSSVEQAQREQARLDSEYNQSLAAEKRLREQQQKEYDNNLNTYEIVSHINSTFLTEASGTSASRQSSKMRADLFKGITTEQRKEILDTQERQRMEQQKRLDEKIKEEERWAIQETMNNRALNLLERERVRNSREKAIQIRRENEAKAIEDKKRRTYIDKVLYTNAPQDAYFMQFNTTSR